MKVSNSYIAGNAKVFKALQSVFIQVGRGYDVYLINHLHVSAVEFDEEDEETPICVTGKSSNLYIEGSREDFEKLVQQLVARSKEPLRKFVTLKQVKEL